LIQKKLYPNIDFYSGIALKALGFPTEMFTALFAIAVCYRPHCGLDRAVEGDVRGPDTAHQQAAPALYRRKRSVLHFDRGALISIFLFGITGGDVFPGQPIRNAVLD